MATSTAKILTRKFVFDDKNTKTDLPDPNPAFSPEQVRTFYGTTHSALTNAAITQETDAQGAEVITFKTYAGTKG